MPLTFLRIPASSITSLRQPLRGASTALALRWTQETIATTDVRERICSSGSVWRTTPCSRYRPGDAAFLAVVSRGGDEGCTKLMPTRTSSTRTPRLPARARARGIVMLVSPCSRYQPGDAARLAAVVRAGGGGRTMLIPTCTPSRGGAYPTVMAMSLALFAESCALGSVLRGSPCSLYRPGDVASLAAVARIGDGGRTMLTPTCTPYTWTLRSA